MQKYLKIGISYLRGQYLPHLLLTLLFCLASVGFMSFQNLAVEQSAKVLEMYVSLAGIFLLTPLFMPEQNQDIWQLEKSKATPMWQLYLVRLFLGIVFMVSVITLFMAVLDRNGSVVLWNWMWVGGISEMLFLGAVGFAVSGITNQAVIGYMIAVVYYLSNMGGRKYFGKLALFQMMDGNYDFAGWMLLVSAVLIVASVIIRERQK